VKRRKPHEYANRAAGHMAWRASHEEFDMTPGLKPPTKKTCWFLENRDVIIAVDKATGCVRSMRFKKTKVDPLATLRQNMGGRVGYLRVYDEHDRRSYDDLADRCRVTNATKRGGKITMTKRFAGAPFVLTVTMRLTDESLMWEVRAVKANRKVADRSLRVGFNVPLIAGWDVWAPCLNGEFAFDGMDDFNFNHLQVTFVSPREIVLPMVSHYSKDLDVGYSILEPIGDKVPAARFQFSNAEKLFCWGYNRKPVRAMPTLEALNYYIGLVGDRPMSTRVEMVFHEGDWRPGLGRVYRKYREYFDPDSKAIYDFEGVFNCGGAHIGDDPKPYVDLGLKTLEVHGHFSYYSDYFQDGQERWRRIGIAERIYRKFKGTKKEMDAWEVLDWLDAHTPQQWAKEVYGPDLEKDFDVETEFFHTRSRIKKRLRNIRKAGVYPFWYFNYTDGFRPVAEKRWPDAICRDQDGKPIPSGWHMSHNLNADLSTSYGRFCDESIPKILNGYPELVGFFLDCFRHYEVDYAHDDGITVVDGRPAYSVNFSYDGITERMKQHCRATGKPMAIFANKPQTVRCMRHVDGVLLEGDGDQAEEKYFWTCIAKPNFFMWTSNRHEVDENLRRAILHGCFPKLTKTDDPAEHRKMVALYRRYLPLYEPFRRRVLCFEPDPMRVPRGSRGKLYTVAGGYVAGIVNTAIDSGGRIAHARTPYALFRVKRGWDVGKVAVMVPGEKKMRPVKFRFDGTFIAVPMPEYVNCAVVKLFVNKKTGKRIGKARFTGPVDFCGDPESSFQDISKR